MNTPRHVVLTQGTHVIDFVVQNLTINQSWDAHWAELEFTTFDIHSIPKGFATSHWNVQFSTTEFPPSLPQKCTISYQGDEFWVEVELTDVTITQQHDGFVLHGTVLAADYTAQTLEYGLDDPNVEHV